MRERVSERERMWFFSWKEDTSTDWWTKDGTESLWLSSFLTHPSFSMFYIYYSQKTLYILPSSHLHIFLISIFLWKMGRAPCCDKNGLKKGPWTVEEDQKSPHYKEQVCVIATSCALLYLQGLKFQWFFVDLFVMFSVENLRGFLTS